MSSLAGILTNGKTITQNGEAVKPLTSETTKEDTAPLPQRSEWQRDTDIYHFVRDQNRGSLKFQSFTNATPSDGFRRIGSGLNPEFEDKNPGCDIGNEQSEITLSPRLQEILVSLDDKKANPQRPHRANRAREKVIEQAYIRCLSDAELQARRDDSIKETSEKMFENWKRKEHERKEKSRDETNSLKSTLDTQLEEGHKRSDEERANRINAKMNFVLPPTAGKNVTRSGISASMKEDEFCKGLSMQIQSNADKRAREREQTLREEREYLDHVAMELDMQSTVDRAAHLEKQQVLLEAWERDGHIRNMKRLQVCGAQAISSYIKTNMPDAFNEINSVNDSSLTIGMVGMGVGYDPRSRR